MPTRTIALTKSAQQTGTAYGQMGFRFVVTAHDGVNVPNEIFRFLRRPLDPANTSGTQEDVFSGICRPEELVSLPINNPSDGSDPAWLRLAALDLVMASEEEADLAWTQIKADVNLLLLALKKMDSLGNAETVTVTV